MAERVILHVGTPKTGTSWMQDLLFNNRKALAKSGFRYPADRFDAHFLAALDLMQLPWGGLEAQAAGAWEHLVKQTRKWSDTVVISHEIFAHATPQQATRALAELGGEVDLVLSTRDLARQIPAEWQENVKHRRSLTYAEFLRRIRHPERKGRMAQWFWGVQEVPAILARWGADLPPERVHVVTVPPPGAPRHLLGERFSTALGIDLSALTEPSARPNPSLGVVETALVRQLNALISDTVANDHFRFLVREKLVHQSMALAEQSARLGVPEDVFEWTKDLSREWIGAIEQAGYHVIGDLDDLNPRPGQYQDPDQPDPELLAEVSVRALARMTELAAELREQDIQRGRDIDGLMAQIDEAYLRPSYKFRQNFVAAATQSRMLSAALRAYRRLRGRNSRSA